MTGAESHPQAVVAITVDGVSLDGVLRRRLLRLSHIDNRGLEADTVDIDLDDSDGALELPPRGAVITLAFGWTTDGLADKGQFTVAEVSHGGAPDVLSIRAASADLGAGMTTQRERAWDSTTIGAIVRTIAKENGLQPVIHASLDGLPVEHIDQTNETSANFLTRLGERHDAIATVKNGRLLFTPAGAGITASGREIPAVFISRRSGDRHRFLIADRVAYQAVRALYHDVNLAVKGEAIWGDVEDSSERGIPATPAPAPTAGQYKALSSTYPTRAKALRAARAEWKRLQAAPASRAAFVGVRAKYDDRNLSASGEVTYGKADEEKRSAAAQRQAERDATAAGSRNAFERRADNVKTLRHVYANRTNALRAARAEWRRLQRGVATFQIMLARGIPELYPEIPAVVSGFKQQIDSTDWIITRVTNDIDADGGFTQRLELEIKATEIPG